MPKTNPIVDAYKAERASALLYETLADIEKDTRIAEVYRRIAKTELKHAEKWVKQAKETGLDLPEYKPNLRTRILITLGLLLVYRIGSYIVLPGVDSLKMASASTGGGGIVEILSIFTGGAASADRVLADAVVASVQYQGAVRRVAAANAGSPRPVDDTGSACSVQREVRPT